MPPEKKEKKAHPLVGRWFHGANGNNKWQGNVLASVGDGDFLVQLYDWFDNAPGAQRLVSLDDMRGWKFYSSHEAMVEAYRHRQGEDAPTVTPLPA